MGWSIGYDTRWNRDIGYGVPAVCDAPTCDAEIDLGSRMFAARSHMEATLGAACTSALATLHITRSLASNCALAAWQ